MTYDTYEGDSTLTGERSELSRQPILVGVTENSTQAFFTALLHTMRRRGSSFALNQGSEGFAYSEELTEGIPALKKGGTTSAGALALKSAVLFERPVAIITPPAHFVTQSYFMFLRDHPDICLDTTVVFSVPDSRIGNRLKEDLFLLATDEFRKESGVRKVGHLRDQMGSDFAFITPQNNIMAAITVPENPAGFVAATTRITEGLRDELSDLAEVIPFDTPVHSSLFLPPHVN